MWQCGKRWQCQWLYESVTVLLGFINVYCVSLCLSFDRFLLTYKMYTRLVQVPVPHYFDQDKF